VQQHRLTFTVTPVERGMSDLFYTVWWPRLPGDESWTPPPVLLERIEKEFLSTMEDDLEIWRHQRHVEKPPWRSRTPSRTRR
jgi:3-ketosteroid 9alpha-monooxygenase subunit A